jgi:hypothetical protein
MHPLSGVSTTAGGCPFFIAAPIVRPWGIGAAAVQGIRPARLGRGTGHSSKSRRGLLCRYGNVGDNVAPGARGAE